MPKKKLKKYRPKSFLLKVLLEPIEVGADVYTLDEWQEAVKSKAFIDYDGYGKLAYLSGNFRSAQGVSEICIRPSDINHHWYALITQYFSHIVWFNR